MWKDAWYVFVPFLKVWKRSLIFFFFLPIALHYNLMTSNSCLLPILLAFVYRHFLLILFLFFIFCFRIPSPALLSMSEPHDGSFELHNSFPSPSFLRSLKYAQKVCQFWTLGGWYPSWIPSNPEKLEFKEVTQDCINTQTSMSCYLALC